MADSTCVKCGHKTFEMAYTDKIEKAKSPLFFVQCAACGGVVGVTGLMNLDAHLTEILQKLRRILKG